MNDAHVEIDLREVDLNVLVAFDALLDTRSVTRAAQRLGVTQSAMSHTLRKLRELLDDPLLVRGRGGMVPTPRAEALLAPIRGGLVSLSRALQTPVTFDPSTSRRTFKIVSPDLFHLFALPDLLRRVRDRAPGIDLAMPSLSPRRVADELESGAIDLAVAPVMLDAPPEDAMSSQHPELRQRVLLREGFRCYARPDHPRLANRRRMTIETFLDLPHLLVSPTGEGGGPVDRVLAERGQSRRIALRTPTLATAPPLLLESDLLLTAPETLEHAWPFETPPLTFACPVPLSRYAVTMLWHPRYDTDPAHRWLRELVLEVVARR